jgi:membrane protein implicated in regulation of membrane protease activity
VRRLLDSSTETDKGELNSQIASVSNRRFRKRTERVRRGKIKVRDITWSVDRLLELGGKSTSVKEIMEDQSVNPKHLP